MTRREYRGDPIDGTVQYLTERPDLDGGPTQKAVSPEAREWTGDDGTDVTIQQELIGDFADVGDTIPLSENRDGDPLLSNLLDKVIEGEEIAEQARVEAPTVPFETNLPWAGILSVREGVKMCIVKASSQHQVPPITIATSTTSRAKRGML